MTAASNNNAKQEPLWPQPCRIIGGTGEVYAGKSLFGVTIAKPDRTLVYDFEGSTETYQPSMGFTRIDVRAEVAKRNPKGAKPVDMFLWWRDHVRGVPSGKYDVIDVDPISDVESGVVEWVQKNPTEHGYTAGQFSRAPGLVWAAVGQWWKTFLLNELAMKCQTFYFVTHMKYEWAGNAPTRNRLPKGKSALMEVANLYLQFERKKDRKGKMPAAPSATVIKSRLLGPGFVPALPPRIPVATPAAIRHYMLNPPDPENLKAGEFAPDAEATPEELAAMALATAEAEREREALALQRQQLVQQNGGAAALARAVGAANLAAAVAAELSPEDHPDDEGEQVAGDVADEPPAASPAPEPIRMIRSDQRVKLQGLRLLARMTDEAYARSLAKRGCASEADLTEEQADELAAAIKARVDAAGPTGVKPPQVQQAAATGN